MNFAAFVALAAAATDDVSPYSGVAAADEYQRRLAAFQADASIGLAKWINRAQRNPSGSSSPSSQMV